MEVNSTNGIYKSTCGYGRLAEANKGALMGRCLDMNMKSMKVLQGVQYALP